jgi:hypothetical protein
MSELLVQLPSGTSYRPGETLKGSAAWRLDAPVEQMEVRLLWFTRGKGTQDVTVHAARTFPSPALTAQQPFEFNLPDAPYSFSGRLISLTWALELVTPKANESHRVEFVLSPTGQEIVLGSADEPSL